MEECRLSPRTLIVVQPTNPRPGLRNCRSGMGDCWFRFEVGSPNNNPSTRTRNCKSGIGDCRFSFRTWSVVQPNKLSTRTKNCMSGMGNCRLSFRTWTVKSNQQTLNPDKKLLFTNTKSEFT
ncbi:hypothetical protein AVEN_49852-1 [Araneus ventricosus]|uniref:Uncharacterized protein n=1 Tax=Araneus ventricosus TaxID=182803 RepID=A0A4Y2MTY4_ARAVE|nr:hypothetical protein AVEN_49852-1 [Araneus ventricosus]